MTSATVDGTAEVPAPNHRRRRRLLGLLTLVAVIGLVVAARELPLATWLQELRNWLEPLGWQGALALIIIIAVWNVVLPPAPLQFLAAAVYGLVWGIFIFYIGATLALLFVIMVARTWAHDLVRRELDRRPKIDVIERALVHHGWKAVMLLRLAGGIPSTLANVMLGCSRVPAITIVWASWVGKFPGILLMGLLGAASGRLVEQPESSSTGTWVLLGIGVVASVILIVLIGRTARRLWQAELAHEAAVHK